MFEIRNGVECFRLKDRQVLITPELKKVRIPLDLEFPPLKIEDLPESLIKRLKKRDIIVSKLVNQLKPPFEEEILLEKITFKNVAISRVDYLFQEFLRNSNMVPVITIDCSLEVTKRLLNLLNQKYHENSINPVVKIFIREKVEEFLEIIKEFNDARESIELNNLIMIFHSNVINKEIIDKAKNSIDPLEIYLYIEDPPKKVQDLKDIFDKYNLPILLEINEKIHSFDLTQIMELPVVINDDSIARLINAFKLKSYLDFDVIRNQLFLPYCDACNKRIFVEGEGKIYACNTGYQSNDLLGSIEENSLSEILDSENFRDLRIKIQSNFYNYQKSSALSNFYSGCLYLNKFEKRKSMKKILESQIQ